MRLTWFPMRRPRPIGMIRLRRVWGRQPCVLLYPDRLRLVLPYFFGRRAIEVALGQVVARAVHLTSERSVFGYEMGIEHGGLLIPYLPTRDSTVPRHVDTGPPNLLLVFAVPVRLPPLRLLATQSHSLLPFGYISTRAKAGVTVDGVFLRAVNPETALETLAAAGVEVTADWREWLRAHPRDATVDADRKAARRHYLETTRNLLVVWVLLLFLALAAAVALSLAL